MELLLKEFDLHTKGDLFYRIALGKIHATTIQKVFKIQKKRHKSGFKRLLWWTRDKEASSTLSQMIQDQAKENPETLVLEDNIEDIKYNISKCCNPIPGDDVVGFITHKNVIRIHRTNCNEAIKQMSRYGNRIVKAKWRSHDEIGFLTGIRFDGMDKKGLLNEITNIIVKKHDINIRSINVKSHQGITDGEIILYIDDTQKLYELMEHLRSIPQLEHVTRINRSVE